MPFGRERWQVLLLVLVGANLVGSVVFLAAEEVVPSFLLYGVALVAGSARLVRGAGTQGVVLLAVAALAFCLVHLPFTRFGPEGSACREEIGCDPVVAWTTLTILPAALLLGATLAWRDLRRP